MVDEYQDTNEAQDMLFRAISQDEKNLFMVGDVKQSIYSFRQAMPSIFLERRHSFPEYQRELNQYPAYLILDKNFRSRETGNGYHQFCVSRKLCRPKQAMLRMKEKNCWYQGHNIRNMTSAQTQLDIIDLAAVQDETEDETTTVLGKPSYCKYHTKNGERILFCNMKTGKQRPVKYGDFCILLRSANKHAPGLCKRVGKIRYTRMGRYSQRIFPYGGSSGYAVAAAGD